MSETGNLFALEPLLIARLGAVLPPTVQVLTAPYLDDLRALEGRARRLPAAFIMHLDGEPLGLDAARPRGGLRLRQRWAVILAVLERADLVSGAGARSQAGELAHAAVAALHGWQPVERGTALALVRLLSPLYIEGGLQLLPLIFTHDTPRLCG